MTVPYYDDGRITVWQGDCLNVLAGMPDDSIDAVVTDPPYGLEFMGKDWDSFRYSNSGLKETKFKDLGALPSYSPNRRNKKCPSCGKWAYDHPGRKCECGGWKQPAQRAYMHAFQQWCQAWAAECLRVLRPGGHLLAFGGTRTAHRLTAGIEDAGFEIRDSIVWLYGQGFPKSLDVSKAIDRRPGVDRHREFAAHLAERREACGLTRSQVSQAVVGTPSGACWNWEHHQFPEAKWWPALRDLLALDPAWDEVIAEAERQATGRHVNGIYTGPAGVGAGGIPQDRRDIPSTAEAAQWQGWGTALKPAVEPITVARKPLAAGTVAGNVLRYGTGALNIDAARIDTEKSWPTSKRTSPGQMAGGLGKLGGELIETEHDGKGRWPANVVLDEHTADLLDQQTGETVSRAADMSKPMQRQDNEVYGKGLGSIGPENTYTDVGGASRFFYTAKASPAERISHNGITHPTQKPLELIRWLVRLVTPPGGRVLDLFAGSGTTAEACLLEGFACTAIEKGGPPGSDEAEYLPMIVQRLNRRRDPVAFLRAANQELGLFDDEGQLP